MATKSTPASKQRLDSWKHLLDAQLDHHQIKPTQRKTWSEAGFGASLLEIVAKYSSIFSNYYDQYAGWMEFVRKNAFLSSSTTRIEPSYVWAPYVPMQVTSYTTTTATTMPINPAYLIKPIDIL